MCTWAQTTAGWSRVFGVDRKGCVLRPHAMAYALRVTHQRRFVALNCNNGKPAILFALPDFSWRSGLFLFIGSGWISVRRIDPIEIPCSILGGRRNVGQILSPSFNRV